MSITQVLQSHIVDDKDDDSLRIAFDFDGVLAEDESETEMFRINDMKSSLSRIFQILTESCFPLALPPCDVWRSLKKS